jgi:hypothetical protein
MAAGRPNTRPGSSNPKVDMFTLICNLAATLLMTGLIWFVQVVHYPLFAGVGEERFVAYQATHSRSTTFVVAPLMTIELVTSGMLALDAPEGVAGWAMWLGLGLTGVTWLATAFLSVPQHNRLEIAFDHEAWRRLVATNWVRTVAWTAHAVLLLGVVSVLLER